MDCRVFVFGHYGCKFCNDQKHYMQNTFGNKGWSYVDLSQKDNLRLAMKKDIGIEEIPATIIMGESGNTLLVKQKGILPPDKIFSYLNPGFKKIPISNLGLDEVLNEGKNYVLSTFNARYSLEDNVKLCKYNGEELFDVRVIGLEKRKIEDFTDEEISNYLKLGGKKMGTTLLVKFDRI